MFLFNRNISIPAHRGEWNIGTLFRVDCTIIILVPKLEAFTVSISIFQSTLVFVSLLWQYGLWSFQTEDKKLERFLPKNQHAQRILLNFEFWINGELSKSDKIWLSKSIFYVKKVFFVIEEYEFRSTFFVIDIFS